MDGSASVLSLLVLILLFTTFVKTLTVLSICRYGLGLVGFEFGVVCLVVSLGLSVFLSPPELVSLGLPDALFSRTQSVQLESAKDALIPFMRRRLDPTVAEHFIPTSKEGTAQSSEPQQAPSDASAQLRSLAPAFLLSELKAAFQIGSLLLIPLVLIDLLTAHILALVGVRSLSAQAIALPLKILVFISAGGWGLLGRKLVGVE
jgi:flagellar biosynthesis protein FliP